MAKKPTIKKGPASQYEAPNETIREFSDGKGLGGLLAVRKMDDGTLLVDLYQLNPEVAVNVPIENLNAPGETTVLSFTPAELDYLARAVDLGRSDDEARAHLDPAERGDLMRKLGGRRD